MRHYLYSSILVMLAGCAAVPSDRDSRDTPTDASVGGVESAVSHVESPVADRERPPVSEHAQDRHCLALAMYWEARGEGRTGMVAVGFVVRNRVRDPRFPNAVCDVVYEGGETPPCQFSWWCDGRSDRPTDATQWRRSLELAREMLTTSVEDPTQGALFFHSTAMASPWRRTRTAKIGNHIFYR